MPHVIGTSELALVEMWENKYLLGMSAGGVPWYIALSLMWHIYDCLYRDRWASHRLGSPVKCNVCECSYNLRCSAAADTNLEGAVGRQPVPLRQRVLCGPVCAAGLTTSIISII